MRRLFKCVHQCDISSFVSIARSWHVSAPFVAAGRLQLLLLRCGGPNYFPAAGPLTGVTEPPIRPVAALDGGASGRFSGPLTPAATKKAKLALNPCPSARAHLSFIFRLLPVLRLLDSVSTSLIFSSPGFLHSSLSSRRDFNFVLVPGFTQFSLLTLSLT